MMKNDITYERVSQLLSYDPKTGALFWSGKRQGRKLGARAGFEDEGSGYWRVTIDGSPYSQHRIVWLLHYKEFPNCQIDHINRNKKDNRIENLRLAPRNAVDNGQNRSIPKNNKSGVPGVCLRKKANKWRAYITTNRQVIELGLFTDFNDAVAARRAAELKYFTFVNP